MKFDHARHSFVRQFTYDQTPKLTQEALLTDPRSGPGQGHSFFFLDNTPYSDSYLSLLRYIFRYMGSWYLQIRSETHQWASTPSEREEGGSSPFTLQKQR